MKILTSLICAVLLAGAAILEHEAARDRTSLTLAVIAVLFLLGALVSRRSSR